MPEKNVPPGESDAGNTDDGRDAGRNSDNGQDTSRNGDTGDSDAARAEFERRLAAQDKENKRLRGVIAKLEPNTDTLTAQLESERDARKAEQDAWEVERQKGRDNAKAAIAENERLNKVAIADKRRATIVTYLGIKDPRIAEFALVEIEQAGAQAETDMGDADAFQGLLDEWSARDENAPHVGRNLDSNTPFVRGRSGNRVVGPTEILWERANDASLPASVRKSARQVATMRDANYARQGRV